MPLACSEHTYRRMTARATVSERMTRLSIEIESFGPLRGLNRSPGSLSGFFGRRSPHPPQPAPAHILPAHRCQQPTPVPAAVLNAFLILGIVTAIYAILAVQFYSARSPVLFGDFSRSFFTV
jgi:hypothetical protein